MAEAKKSIRSTRKASNSWKGIPASERRDVRMWIAVTSIDGKKVTPGRVYEKILAQRAEESEKKTAADEKDRVEFLDRAREALDPALIKLATVRDVLRYLGNGGEHMAGLDVIDSTVLCRALLSESAGEIEQALFDLGLVERFQGSEGVFVENVRGAKPEAQASDS